MMPRRLGPLAAALATVFFLASCTTSDAPPEASRTTPPTAAASESAAAPGDDASEEPTETSSEPAAASADLEVLWQFPESQPSFQLRVAGSQDFVDVKPAEANAQQRLVLEKNTAVRMEWTTDAEGEPSAASVEEIRLAGGAASATPIAPPEGYTFLAENLVTYGGRAYTVVRQDSNFCVASWAIGKDKAAKTEECPDTPIANLVAGPKGVTARQFEKDSNNATTISLHGDEVPPALQQTPRVLLSNAGAVGFTTPLQTRTSERFIVVDKDGAATKLTPFDPGVEPVACGSAVYFTVPQPNSELQLVAYRGGEPKPLTNPETALPYTSVDALTCNNGRLLIQEGNRLSVIQRP